MKNWRKWRTILVLAIIFIVVVVAMVFVINRYKQESDFRKECEDTKQVVQEMVEKYIEALNNRDYEAYSELCSEKRKENVPDLESMYSFLADEKNALGEPLDYSDFDFKLKPIDLERLDRHLKKEGIKAALFGGVYFDIEFGDSETRYESYGNIAFVIENGEIKIEYIFYPDNPTKNVKTNEE